ncbi:MAG: hypothetical protein ACRYFZ_01670 [Janthinobacterium lividum]
MRNTQSSIPAPGDNYISGEFGGTPVYCVADKGLSQTSYYHIDVTQNADYCSLFTQTLPEDVELSINFLNTGLFQKQLPTSWPHANPAYCEQASVILTEKGPGNKVVSVFRGGSGYSSPLQVQVTSVSNEIVEGTFEGKLFRYIDDKYAYDFIFVKNGKFRVKVHKQLP